MPRRIGLSPARKSDIWVCPRAAIAQEAEANSQDRLLTVKVPSHDQASGTAPLMASGLPGGGARLGRNDPARAAAAVAWPAGGIRLKP
jgi:hypothetical protein